MGSYRRGKNESKDADILIYPIVKNPKTKNLLNRIVEEIRKHKWKIKVYSFGSHTLSGVVELNNIFRRIDCWICKYKEYPFALLAWTGSGPYNIELRKIAISKGWKLTDKSLTDKNNQVKLKNGSSIKNEKDIFKALNVKYIKPQERN